MLVSDCCGATPDDQKIARINGNGVCSCCSEDCEYITDVEFYDREEEKENPATTGLTENDMSINNT